ncbi:MAG: dimethyl sulfoxide reductase anchor subunit [Limnochordaceae bacterium]|nr:dimethyl sulfoxide reductase anchor subunit [Limnochordaceae bacterium]
MEPREWSLVVFTVLMQACVGAFLLNLWLRERSKDSGVPHDRVEFVLIPVAILAMLASLAHLGRPLYALNSLLNLGSSWLSREIFFTGAFVALLVVAVLLRRNPRLQRSVEYVVAAAGIACIASMASIYTHAVKPAWEGFYTYVAFGATALLAGTALTAGVLAVTGQRDEGLARDLKDLSWVAIVVALAEVVVLPLYLVSLASGDPAAQATAGLLAGPYAPWLLLRWVLLLGGGVVPLVMVLRRAADGPAPASLVYLAGIAIIAGEVVGRYLFYATAIPTGIG